VCPGAAPRPRPAEPARGGHAAVRPASAQAADRIHQDGETKGAFPQKTTERIVGLWWKNGMSRAAQLGERR